MNLSTSEEIRRDQVIGRIDMSYIEIIHNINSDPNKIIIPIINAIIGQGNQLQLPEKTILKFAIIEYHKALSTVMTEIKYEKMMETVIINTNEILKGEKI